MTRRAATVALLVVTGLAVGIAIGSAGAIATPDADQRGASPALAQPEANNTTHHDHPDRVGESDRDSTRRWLESQLAGTLGESSIQISQGEYERARELVDDDAAELLDKYVDVAGETDDERDDETAESFEETRDDQEDFLNETQEYEETYQEYQEARQSGDERRARELARDLERLSENASATGRSLTRNYRNVSARTGADLQDAELAVNRTVENITERQAEVRETTFLRTELQVETTADTFSFREPLPITGRIVAENGSALDNRTVTIRVGRSTRSVETDANGTFSLEYRPVLLPAGTDEVPVRYRPRDDSPYLGSNTSMAATLERSIPEISVTVDPDEARFGDTVRVTGAVTVNGTGVDGLPLVVDLGDRRFAELRTDSDGRFAVEAAVPADVPAGETTVTARVGVANRSIAEANGTTALRIRPTETDLSITATYSAEGIRANGTLTTAGGRPVANQTVRVTVADRTLTTVETDSEGRYETTVAVPENLDDDGSTVNVTAAFRGDGLNLESATAATRVSLPSGAGGAVGATEPTLADRLLEFVRAQPLLAGGIAAALVLGALGAALLAGRRRGADEELVSDEEPRAVDTTSTPETSPANAFLSQARAKLAEDPQAAVRLGYAAVRERFGADAAATHWEFYGDVRDEVADEATLRSLTETYERAVFGHGADDDAAADAVESATTLARGEPSPDGGSSELD